MRFRSRKGTPTRITDARPGLTEDIRHRQRRYAVTMGIRTVCVILAIVLWQVNRIAAVIALVAGGVLPYIAVVLANAGHERSSEPMDAPVTPERPRGLPNGPPPEPPPSSPPPPRRGS